MQCFHPISISNPDFDSNEISTKTIYKKIFVPCGRCPACVVGSAHEWRVRLQEELRSCNSAFFITLTYDDDSLPIQDVSGITGYSVVCPVVSKRDVQLFLKRLRKKFRTSKIRYFLVSEYGPTTLRPHYHAIFFNLPYSGSDISFVTAKVNKELREIWNHGNILVDNVTYGRISYVTKYLCSVTDLPPYLPKPFRLMSRRPGIGYNYLLQSNRIFWHRSTLSNFYPQGNLKLRLPRFYKDKIFDDAMKLEISERSKEYIANTYYEQKNLAQSLGYRSWYDFRVSSEDAFNRKFNKQMKKSRKDI